MFHFSLSFEIKYRDPKKTRRNVVEVQRHKNTREWYLERLGTNLMLIYCQVIACPLGPPLSRTWAAAVADVVGGHHRRLVACQPKSSATFFRLVSLSRERGALISQSCSPGSRTINYPYLNARWTRRVGQVDGFVTRINFSDALNVVEIKRDAALSLYPLVSREKSKEQENVLYIYKFAYRMFQKYVDSMSFW